MRLISSLQTQLKTYARAIPYYRPYWWMISLGMLAAMAMGALDAVMPLGIKLYLELFIEKTGLEALNVNLPASLSFIENALSWVRDLLASDQGAWLIPLGIVVFTLLQGAFSYAAIFFNTRVGAEVTADMKRDLYDKLMSFETAYFDLHDSGLVLFKVHHDTDAACANLVQSVKSMLTRTFSLLALSTTLLALSWKLALMALVVLGLAVLPLTLTRKYLKHISGENVVAASKVATHFTETCQGSRVIASYNLEKRQSEKLGQILDSVKFVTLHIAKLQGAVKPLMHSIAGVGVGLVLWFGTQLIQAGELTIGSFAAFLTSLILLYTPVKSMSNTSVTIQLSLLALERIFDFKDRLSLVESQPDAPKINGLGGGVTVTNLSFRYHPHGPDVLKDVNLAIQPGETVALVGASGSGKTTLAHLMLRLYDPTEGAISINGADIRTLDLTSVRQQMAAVFQDNFIFMGTIRENLLLGKLDATEQELNHAIKAAYLEDFVNGLPNCLETEVGERGVSLSGGQKQRIAIARALLKDASLVVLDEATSALDNQSEAIVQKALDTLMKNRTVVVIAHRLSTVQNADRIVVMEQGRVVETGTHQELLAQRGAYNLLYQAQFKSAEKVAA